MEPLYLTALGFSALSASACSRLSGALPAAQKRQDFVTFVFFAVVAGAGGGTARDLLICMGAALLAWFTPLRLWGRSGLVRADALGIAPYATYGAAKAGQCLGPLPAVGMGVLIVFLGGILRDVLAGEPSILLRQKFYLTAAALSAGLMVALSPAGTPEPSAGSIAVVVGFGLRAAAIARGWTLPTHRR